MLLQAVNRSAASPGGIVDLHSTGNLNLGAGTSINVAGKQNAPAGSLSIASGGAASLAGTLNGAAGTSGAGGRFSLDAGTLTGDLTPLALTLTNGGFDNLVEVRVRSGDLNLQSGSSIDSNDIVLSADAGAVNIAGTLVASSGAQRGRIELSGGTGATLASTGQLHADGTGAKGLGGKIQINSSCPACAITLSPGSVISASGMGQMGELVLRAPALTATNDVAINPGAQGIGADVTQAGQVLIDPILVFQTTPGTVNADLDAGVHAASNFLTAAGAPIAARLAGSNVSVQAGVELQDANPADTLSLQSYDLSRFSASGGPGQVIDLSVRTAGSLEINGAISDGFIAEPNTGLLALSNTASGSLSLVAGADLAGANPLSVLSGSNANLTLRTSNQRPDGTPDGIGPSVVRTGTGDINLVAANDVVFEAGTAAYTGGEAPANVSGPVEIDGNTPQLQNFGTNGGSVRLNAGRDVVGSPVGAIANTNNGNYSVSGWQLRQGNADNPAQFGINFAAFDWNLGALAGGDVSIDAGRNVNDLSAATADTRVAGSGDSAVSIDGKDHLYGAGGGLAIRAGGDIGSAQVYIADGAGSLAAGGGLTTTRTVSTNKLPVGSAIALGDSQVSVWARQDLQVDAIYNPTFVPQLLGFTSPDTSGAYFTYGQNSGVSLSSTTGAVTLELSTQNGTMGTLLGTKLVASSGASGLLVSPPNLSIQALQGDINLVSAQADYLYPSSTGQLSLFAGRDIAAIGGFTMSDSAATSFPTAADPGIQQSLSRNTFSGLSPFQGVIHVGDSQPALITAGRDISQLFLSVPKAADVVAGRDLVNLQYAGQNTDPGDTTLIVAGRDLLNTPAQGTFPGIQLGGRGSLDVMTGRDLNLGARNGIITLGNLANPNLATSQGADLNVMVGYGAAGADYSGFLQKIVAPSASYAADLISYVDSITGGSGSTLAQAEAQFAEFSNPQQGAFIDNVFFNELLLSGRAANSGAGIGFKQGYEAIDALFPNSRSGAPGTNPYAGDLTLTSSQIYTFSGGNISLIVPGGKIDVGLANPPVGIAFKSASQLGIVAQGAGDVRIYSQGDVNVNQSRIFTLGGGNILIWSDEGSIDAGNGSKSSLSVPPPIVLIAADGTIQLDFAGSLASGSGIRTIQTGSDVPPGNVDLDAPVGTVNAGDAGIGSAGNINIAAQHVIGVDNINFGGTAAGVPSDLSGLGASLSGVSAVAAGTTSSATSSVEESNQSKEAAPLAETALSWLDVFVTGLGEENCKPDDIECLKRQKAAAP
jgi:filamentous hemagglutinin